MRVLQSFPFNRPTTNPYLLQLTQAVAEHAEVVGFSWRNALLGRYDVFHAHWPEVLLHGSTPARTAARRLLFRVLLARLASRRIAVVRTLHNVRSHEPAPAGEQRLLDRFDRRTDLWIRLNAATEVPPGAPVRTIRHGHYRDWFAAFPRSEPIPQRLLFFGLIRPYKGVETLIDAVHALAAQEGTADVSLRIVGRPYSTDVARDLERRAGSDPHVGLRLGHASDDALAAEVYASALVVLPYREMHNSGAALLALSLDRPVLVPSNVVTEALREEVGAEWVQTYSGEFQAEAIRAALERPAQPPGTRPDLSARDWPAIGAEHADAYAAAARERKARRARLSRGSRARRR